MPTLRTILLSLLLLGCFSGPSTSSQEEPLLERFALGSCAHQLYPQPIWDAISAREPQLFLFLGDNVYADTEDMEKMRATYRKMASIETFARFREKVPILATWDDHDFGANDAGAEFPKKEESKEIFLDFFAEPADSPRRQRPGIYHASMHGPPGQRVQILLLDGRTFRDPLEEDPSPWRRYRPSTDPDKTLLGDEQWRWLGEQLRRPAEVRFIVSGVQVLGYAAGFEGWKTMPLEQERLFRTVREAEANGVIFLSGDAHFTLLKRGDGGVGYPLYDFTSSGLTHSRPESAERAAPLAILPPYGGLNFGLVEIDWSRDDPRVTLSARDRDGNPVFRHSIDLSELQARREDVS